MTDIDKLIEASKRLERRAAAIPAWMKGTIVFADVKCDKWEHCGLGKGHKGACRTHPLCNCNVCRNDVRSPLPGCKKYGPITQQ